MSRYAKGKKACLTELDEHTVKRDVSTIGLIFDCSWCPLCLKVGKKSIRSISPLCSTNVQRLNLSAGSWLQCHHTLTHDETRHRATFTRHLQAPPATSYSRLAAIIDEKLNRRAASPNEFWTEEWASQYREGRTLDWKIPPGAGLIEESGSVSVRYLPRTWLKPK